MRRIVLSAICLSAVIVASCKKAVNKELTEFDKASWLVGNWENKSSDGLLTENWETVNDSLYKAHCYFVHKKDTLHNEKIELAQKGKDIYYIPTVKGENDNKPVDFKLTTANATQLIFENAEHDYPQKIQYTKVTEDSLMIMISGKLKGKAASERYPMVRVKNSEQ